MSHHDKSKQPHPAESPQEQRTGTLDVAEGAQGVVGQDVEAGPAEGEQAAGGEATIGPGE